MKNKLLVAALLLTPVVSSAAITTYTNQAAWAAATSATSLYDFNSDANGTFTSKDFGDFTATLINESGGNKPSVNNGTLQLQEWNSNSALKITFDSTISAFGFNWSNTDPTGDRIEINILGQNFIFGSKGSGFFGLTSTILFSDALIGDSEGNGGALTYAKLDNFQYSVSAVPVPAAAFLFAPALLGFMGLRRKAKNTIA